MGDGVSVFRDDGRSWTSQLGADLTGLNAVYVSDAPHWWAVGDRNRIARYDTASGCWRAQDDERLIGSVDLSSVMVGRRAPGGWAVGRNGDRGLLLRLTYASGEPRWITVSEEQIGPLPALSDLHVFDSSETVNDAWLVSAAGKEVLRARLGVVAGSRRAVVEITGAVTVTDALGRPARPMEIAMAAPRSGWIAGETLDGGVSAWRHVSGLAWDGEPVAPAQKLVDLYHDEAGRWWLGMTPPDDSEALLRHNERADGQGVWQSADRPPAPPVSGGSAENRAIAPLDRHRVLYALGDDVWLHDAATASWTAVRVRRRLAGIAPNRAGTGGWAIEDLWRDGHLSSRVVSVLEFGLRPMGQSRTFVHIDAVDSDAGLTVAVGDDGRSYRHDGSLGEWHPIPTLEDPASGVVDFTDVSVGGDRVAWASAATGNGGALYKLDEATGTWLEMVSSERPLVSVAALDADNAWAAGTGTVCECIAGSCGCNEELWLGDEPLDLVTVAVARGAESDTGFPVVWAAGAYYALERSSAGWRAADVRAVSGVPQGAGISEVAVASRSDVWVVATCNPYGAQTVGRGRTDLSDGGRSGHGRGVSIVRHLDGSVDRGGRYSSLASTALSVPVSDMKLVTTGAANEVWLSGDWSTVVRLRYVPGMVGELPRVSPPSDLWCLPVERTP